MEGLGFKREKVVELVKLEDVKAIINNLLEDELGIDLESSDGIRQFILECLEYRGQTSEVELEIHTLFQKQSNLGRDLLQQATLLFPELVVTSFFESLSIKDVKQDISDFNLYALLSMLPLFKQGQTDDFRLLLIKLQYSLVENSNMQKEIITAMISNRQVVDQVMLVCIEVLNLPNPNMIQLTPEGMLTTLPYQPLSAQGISVTEETIRVFRHIFKTAVLMQQNAVRANANLHTTNYTLTTIAPIKIPQLQSTFLPVLKEIIDDICKKKKENLLELPTPIEKESEIITNTQEIPRNEKQPQQSELIAKFVKLFSGLQVNKIGDKIDLLDVIQDGQARHLETITRKLIEVITMAINHETPIAFIDHWNKNKPPKSKWKKLTDVGDIYTLRLNIQYRLQITLDPKKGNTIKVTNHDY
jgi:plasmid maintenance system killer protein